LFVIALGLLGGGLMAQQANHKESERQVNVILTADIVGQSTTEQITMLRTYVKNHIGSTIDFTLSGSFNRAQVAAAAYKDALAKAEQANSVIYAQAQAACASIKNAIDQTRCNQQYLNSHLQNVQLPEPVADPVQSDYYYKLVSPPWTADVAGSLFVDAIIAFVLATLSLIFVKEPHK